MLWGRRFFSPGAASFCVIPDASWDEKTHSRCRLHFLDNVHVCGFLFYPNQKWTLAGGVTGLHSGELFFNGEARGAYLRIGIDTTTLMPGGRDNSTRHFLLDQPPDEILGAAIRSFVTGVPMQIYIKSVSPGGFR